jgi:FkbM family methyltransferase
MAMQVVNPVSKTVSKAVRKRPLPRRNDKGARTLRSYFAWRALWHLQFVPRAVALFESPFALLGNYAGVNSETRDYRTRAGQCFSNVSATETETIFCSFVKLEYGDVDVDGDVIDIGANIGAFSLYAASRPKTKRVLAFEPMPDTFRRLTDNVTKSGASDRILCVHSAVSSRSGFVQMILGASSMQHRTSEVRERAPQSGDAVPAISLASIFDFYDVRKCVLLKVDCEGAEYEILENLPPVYFQRIYALRLEIHQRSDGRTPEDLFRFIESRGFRVEKPLQHDVIWFRRAD